MSNPQPYREPWYADQPQDERRPLQRYPVHVMLDNLRSAFNVGSIFRTADAGAVAHLHLCGMTAHPPHKKLEKTALGAFDYVPWTYYERNRACIDALKEQNIPVIAVETVEGAPSLFDMTWSKPVAIVLGNEENGINSRVLARCDGAVQIPMAGYKRSINVATAFGIVLYHILAQWGTPDTPDQLKAVSECMRGEGEGAL